MSPPLSSAAGVVTPTAPTHDRCRPRRWPQPPAAPRALPPAFVALSPAMARTGCRAAASMRRPPARVSAMAGRPALGGWVRRGNGTRVTAGRPAGRSVSRRSAGGRRQPPVATDAAARVGTVGDRPEEPPLGADAGVAAAAAAAAADRLRDRVPTAARVGRLVRGLWQFTRPHTLIGTFLSVLSLSALALRSGPAGGAAAAAGSLLRSAPPEALAPGTAAASPLGALAALPAAVVGAVAAVPAPFWPALWTAMVPALLLNVFIVGLNQLCDIPIDAINKPFLPLPARALSVPAAVAAVLACLAGGVAIGLASPATTLPLQVVLFASTALGVAYSAPPLRLKRFAVLASACVLSVRGLLINAGFFLHMRVALGAGAGTAAVAAAGAMGAAPPTAAAAAATWALMTPVATGACAFFVGYGLLIALFKDVPDVAGDAAHAVRTLSVRLGARRVFGGCVAGLAALFLTASAGTASLATGLAAKVGLAAAHAAAAGVVLSKARSVDVAKEGGNVAEGAPGSVSRYYLRVVWVLFYLEYLLLPFAG